MTRRMRHVVTSPTPRPPTWEPARVTPPAWEVRAAETWQGAAAAIPRGIPRYEGRCVWRQKRNDALRARYGTERLT